MNKLKILLGVSPVLVKKTPSDVAELCKSNCAAAYDLFWKDEDLINAYLEPARVESYMFIVNYLIEKKIYGDRIVDLGFGSGDFLRFLVENMPGQTFDIHGLDYSKSAVIRAKKLIPKGEFIVGDIYNMPYASASFDLVFCIQTLEHLKNSDKVLKEMDRICKPDGMIIISVPNGELDTYGGHVNFWTDSDFRDFLSPRELIDFIIYNQKRVFLAVLKPLKK